MEYRFNKTLSEQEKLFEKILRNNKKLWSVLEILEDYALKNKSFKNYYLGAGALNETVFNYYHNFDDNYGIKDYDIVYFDEDTSYEKEDIIIKELSSLLKDIDVCLDIKNQARVHLWCKGKSEAFSVEEAISRWSTTVTCIGVRVENNTLKGTIDNENNGVVETVDSNLLDKEEDSKDNKKNLKTNSHIKKQRTNCSV